MAVLVDRERLGIFDRCRALWQWVRPITTALPVLVTGLALLAACEADSGDDPTGAVAAAPPAAADSPEPTRGASTDTPAEGPSHAPPEFPEGTRPQTRGGSGGAPLVFTDIRVAEHAGFDRIVLEFSGTSTPGWAVRYVDKATLDGSGRVVRLLGDAILDIYASTTTWPAPAHYRGTRRLEAENGGITEVYAVGTFEGSTQVLAGIDGPRAPFRVFTRTDPSRLVVDVAAAAADAADDDDDDESVA